MEHTMHWVCFWCAVIDPSKMECFDVFNSKLVGKCSKLCMSHHVSSPPCEVKILRTEVSNSDFAMTHLQTAEYGTCSFSLNRGCTRCNCHLPKFQKKMFQKSAFHVKKISHLFRACLMSSSVEIFFSSTSRLAASFQKFQIWETTDIWGWYEQQWCEWCDVIWELRMIQKDWLRVWHTQFCVSLYLSIYTTILIFIILYQSILIYIGLPDWYILIPWIHRFIDSVKTLRSTSPAAASLANLSWDLQHLPAPDEKEFTDHQISGRKNWNEARQWRISQAILNPSWVLQMFIFTFNINFISRVVKTQFWQLLELKRWSRKK